MNKIKSYIFAIAAAAAVVTGLSACQDDVDAPAVDSPQAASVPNTTLAELKELFWNEATNYADTIGTREDGSHYVIHGRVISSDEEGNVFKSLIIQDETAALAFSIDTYNLYLNYRRGQEIVMDVTGMYIGKYAGLQQMGRPSWYSNGSTWQVSFMSNEYFSNHRELNGLPDVAQLDTLVVNTFSELSATPEGLRKWQSQLVRFKNVYFPDGGKLKFSVYHSSSNEDQNRTLTDRNGSTMIVRTSGYSTFFNETLPVGNIDLVGILSYYNTAWQIILIDGNGVIHVGDTPGTKEKPYTVEQAIADETAGISSKGWIKGYIVGAVAPEVEEVTGDSDIEWEAPTVLASTLVIADAPDCRDASKCLVVQLPSGSLFQEVGNLRDNPANLGKSIMVNGNLAKFLGTFGVTGMTGKADEFEIEGIEISTGEIPAGDGSEASPLNTNQVIAMNPSSTTTSPDGGAGVWVSGYIVGYMPTGGSSTTLSGTVFAADANAATTNLVIGPTPDCTDATKCVGVQLPSAMRSELALANQPGNLGKKLSIKGDVMKYCGGPGVKNLTAKNLSGGTTPDTPVTPSNPTGSGTEADPYNVAKALEVTTAMSASDSKTAYVKGIITSITELSTSFGNATYTIADAQGGATLGVYRGYWLNGDKFTSESQLAVGAEVVVTGDLVNYMGNTPQFTTGNHVVSYNGQTEVPDTPQPPVSGDIPSGSGTEASPLNVGQVIALNPTSTSASPEGGAGVWVSGYIVGYMPTGGSSTLLSGTVFAADANAATTNLVIGPTPDCKDASQCVGVQLPAAMRDALALANKPENLGKKLSIKGDVMKYCGGPGVKNLTENKLEEGGSEPDTPDTPDTPGTPSGDVVTIAHTAFTDLEGDKTATADGYTFSFAKNSGATNPKYYAADMRLYAKNTLTIKGGKMAKIVFTLGSVKTRYTTFAPNTGALNPAQAEGDTTITWVGDASEVTFTVGDTALYGAEAGKPGQIRFTSIEIYPAE